MSGLRIAWATPWNEASAIARASSEVAAELVRRGHSVTILRTELGAALDRPPRDTPLPVAALAVTDTATIHREFDVTLASIGDDLLYHGALLPRLPELDAVGIFHDMFLADLIGQWAYSDGRDGAALLRRAVDETYGKAAWNEGEPFVAAETVQDVARRRPMVEWFARQTIAGVVHARHYADRVRSACPGPVSVIPLALDYPDLPPIPPAWNRMTIGVVGNANPNKRIDQVLLAIAASPMLRHCCRVRVIGDAGEERRQKLREYAGQLQIAPPEFTGFVSDEDLRWQLRDIDVISCLRHPVLEGASASLLLALLTGRPTLVSNHGCYAELPEPVVLLCAPGAEAFDVMRHLEALMRDREAGMALGLRGQDVARRYYAPSIYAASLEPVLWQAAQDRPLAAARRALTGTLSEFGLPPADPAMRRVQNAVSRLRTAPAQ